MQLPYPNPFTTDVIITYTVADDANREIDIRITDIVGRLVKTFKVMSAYGQYTVIWHAAGTEKGIYFISLYSNGDLMQTNKVIKQ